MNKIKKFQVYNQNGETITQDNLLGKKTILYFYPKDDTPGCTQEGIEFQENLKKIKKSGYQIFGISRDSQKSHCKFRDKYNYEFDLLSDEDEVLCNIFDVLKEKMNYGRKYIGIERSTFLIDKDLKIIKEWRKVKVQGHVEEVLASLE